MGQDDGRDHLDDHRAIRLDKAVPLGRLDHRDPGPVLHRSARAERFKLPKEPHAERGALTKRPGELDDRHRADKLRNSGRDSDHCRILRNPPQNERGPATWPALAVVNC